MRKIQFIVLFFSITVIAVSQNTTAPFSKQLWKNARFGWDVDKAPDYKWNNFAIGTGIARNFEAVPKGYWFLGGNLNWSKYTLYKDRLYNNTANNMELRTFSVSIPALVGYNILQAKWAGLGMKIYTGPVLEGIMSAKLDGFPYKEYNPLQFGWTVGTGVRFLYLFGFNIAYSYYPTPVLTNGNLIRSSVNFTLGF